MNVPGATGAGHTFQVEIIEDVDARRHDGRNPAKVKSLDRRVLEAVSRSMQA